MNLQQEVNKLFSELSGKTHFVHTKEQVFIHFIEEVGELAKAFLNEKLKREDSNIEEEIADCMIFLIYIASLYNINIECAVMNKLSKLKNKLLNYNEVIE